MNWKCLCLFFVLFCFVFSNELKCILSFQKLPKGMLKSAVVRNQKLLSKSLLISVLKLFELSLILFSIYQGINLLLGESPTYKQEVEAIFVLTKCDILYHHDISNKSIRRRINPPLINPLHVALIFCIWSLNLTKNNHFGKCSKSLVWPC